jgi:hypothetical protein
MSSERDVSKACILSSLGYAWQPAMLALENLIVEQKSELFVQLLNFPTLASHISRSSGCSIVVVYAVWDRVVRVRFPASRH